MASAVEHTDELVREYLIYRGFTNALKQLDSDLKVDRDKGFRVDRITDHLQQLVQSFDLAGLREYWAYLEKRLFSRLEDVYRSTVNKLRTSLYRHYVINTVQKGNVDKTQEFFMKQGPELQSQLEWRDWFVLPFLPAPEQNPLFAPYFSRQWADTFQVSMHNFLSVVFQCMPQPTLLSFDAEVQRMTTISEENEQLRQMLFALQMDSREQDPGLVQHKLPAYVQNTDRLGDTELELVWSQRTAQTTTLPSRNFFSTFLPQSRKTLARPLSSPSQAAVGRKEPPTSQKSKESGAVKEVKQISSQTSSADTPSSQTPAQTSGPLSQPNVQPNAQPNAQPTVQRHRRIQEHEKERKELFTKATPQTPEKKGDSETDSSPQEHSRGAAQGGGGGLSREQPFIKLSQEEYGEHHSSIMHCRVDSSGRRVASLDVDGVVKVWSFNPMMQTKATIMSKSPLLSLEWAAKPDRLLLLGSGVSTVRLYDTDAKKNLYEINIDEAYPRILSLACSPSGSSFVCSAAALSRCGGAETHCVPIPVSGQLLLWDTKTVKQQLRFSLEPEPVAINCTAFNHNGNLLVTGAADGVIRLFDMQRYDCAMSWRAHDGEVYSVEFSYDENTVFSIGEDGKFIQWNIHRCGVQQSEQVLPQDATGPFILSGYSGYKQVQVPRGRLFAFDSEGQHVLTCSNTGGLIHRLSSEEAGALDTVLSLGGHRAPVVTVDWCSALDCGTCLTASMDGKIKLSTLLAQKC
ncbi:WD repeat-containing protein 91 [Periophthalmus magnuspinnatus]|uniref:WD repeat-containing protein 91 n=1 Tax=Periophthalmus magnuspinnatus TaxID=409849 RepID=UPI002436C354|nr:WD repeat-containing protein 91 [Periophthalmus magnuspinnatus]